MRPRDRTRVLLDTAYRLNPELPRTAVSWNDYQTIGPVGAGFCRSCTPCPSTGCRSCVRFSNHVLRELRVGTASMEPATQIKSVSVRVVPV